MDRMGPKVPSAYPIGAYRTGHRVGHSGPDRSLRNQSVPECTSVYDLCHKSYGFRSWYHRYHPPSMVPSGPSGPPIRADSRGTIGTTRIRPGWARWYRLRAHRYHPTAPFGDLCGTYGTT